MAIDNAFNICEKLNGDKIIEIFAYKELVKGTDLKDDI